MIEDFSSRTIPQYRDHALIESLTYALVRRETVLTNRTSIPADERRPVHALPRAGASFSLIGRRKEAPHRILELDRYHPGLSTRGRVSDSPLLPGDARELAPATDHPSATLHHRLSGGPGQ